MHLGRILIVEDEPMVGLELQEALQLHGFDVPCVIDNADDFLKVVLNKQPELVIMDIRLKSYIDGIDAAKRLRTISKIPIIFLSAYWSIDSERKAGNTTPSAILSKPIDFELLVTEIQKLLPVKGNV